MLFPARGFVITEHTHKDSSLSLFQHGEPAYSHLLLFPPKSKGLGPALTANILVDFINQGSNIFLALSSTSSVPSAISSLLLEFDISLPPDRSSVIVDHFSYDVKSASDKHDVLLLQSPTTGKREVKNFFSQSNVIAFPHCVGQVLGNASPLLAPVLQAPSTAYSYNPKDDTMEENQDLFATGTQITLVSAFQARNSARFTVFGSSEALEDKWFTASVQAPGGKAEKTGNRLFAEKVAAWTFKELGVLKVGAIRHWLNEGSQKGSSESTTDLSTFDVNPAIYRIKNDVHFSIEMSEWNMDRWTPFTPPTGDEVQLEVSMLSPFHRLNLSPHQHTANASLYTADFKLPDQHGIFNYFVEYRRPFLTNVEEKVTVTVRHFAHDEWPRSFVISGAWPWISGIWVTVAGWLGFVALWLYCKPVEEKKAGVEKK